MEQQQPPPTHMPPQLRHRCICKLALTQSDRAEPHAHLHICTVSMHGKWEGMGVVAAGAAGEIREVKSSRTDTGTTLPPGFPKGRRPLLLEGASHQVSRSLAQPKTPGDLGEREPRVLGGEEPSAWLTLLRSQGCARTALRLANECLSPQEDRVGES